VTRMTTITNDFSSVRLMCISRPIPNIKEMLSFEEFAYQWIGEARACRSLFLHK